MVLRWASESVRNTTVSVGTGFDVEVVVVAAGTAVRLDDAVDFTHCSRPDDFLHSYFTDLTVRSKPAFAHVPVSASAEIADAPNIRRPAVTTRTILGKVPRLWLDADGAHALAVARLGGVAVARRAKRHQLACHGLVRPVAWHFVRGTHVVKVNA